MADIIGDLHAIEVTAPRWQEAFELLDGSGPPVTLAVGMWQAAYEMRFPRPTVLPVHKID
ncbi:hypothetical protein ACFLRH_03055 [Actinomycetota bacterium]